MQVINGQINIMKHYTINTLKDTTGDAVATGEYIDAKGEVMPFDYCGPYTGLKQALKALREDGAEVVHRVETLHSVGGWLAHEVQEVKQGQGLGFALGAAWGSVGGAE